MPFKKGRELRIKQKKRYVSDRKYDFFERLKDADRNYWGEVYKARMKFGDELGADDIDSIPGIEILKEKKDDK